MVNKSIDLLLIFGLLLSLSTSALVAEDSPKTEPLTITVQKGETLSGISKRYLADSSRWPELLKYNKIPKPDSMKPGLKLVIPVFLQKEVLGVASFVLGKVEYNNMGGVGNWSAVTLGQRFHTNDKIKTSDKGKVDLLLTELGLIRIFSDSSFQVTGKKSATSPFSLAILKGGLSAKIKKSPSLSKDYSLTIVNPSSTAGVRGTEFQIDLDEQKNSVTSCFEGNVEVYAQGETVVLTEGFATFVEKGKAPVKPFAIPGAPKLKTE